MKTFRRIVGIGMLVVVLGVMALGPVTSAQEERGSERSVEDCDAFGGRLREMVENGELTREEAGEQYRAACGERGRERSEEDCQAIGRRIRAAVEASELTREEAGERYRAACDERGSERSEEDQAIGRRLRAAVEASELTREEAGETLEGLRRRMDAGR